LGLRHFRSTKRNSKQPRTSRGSLLTGHYSGKKEVKSDGGKSWCSKKRYDFLQFRCKGEKGKSKTSKGGEGRNDSVTG